MNDRQQTKTNKLILTENYVINDHLNQIVENRSEDKMDKI